jgi:hypothetical protein
MKIILSQLDFNLIGCKMLKSSLDGRLAFVKSIKGDRVFLDMGEIGERNFSIQTIKNGFIPIFRYEDLVLNYFFENYFIDVIYTDYGVYKVSEHIYNALIDRFPDLTSHFIYKTLKDFQVRNDKREGLK